MRKKQAVASILVLFFLESCAGPPPLKAPHLGTPTKTKKESPVAREEESFQKSSNQRPSNQKPSTDSLRTKVILPVVENPKDNSEMIFIPEGPLFVPSLEAKKENRDSEGTTVKLGNYYIDKLEINQDQFNHFLSEKNKKKTEEASSCLTCPATRISFDMASEYCQWAGKRLPSEMEWLKAAGGEANESPWPWGANFEPERANFFGENDGYTAAAPVGSFPLGASEYGVQDMVGNAWEWVSPPYLPGQEHETKVQNGDGILKGGSWRNLPERVDIFYRHQVNKNVALENFGFRCAKTF